MVLSWVERVKEFKSPLYVVAAFLPRSRETQRAKVEELSQLSKDLFARLERLRLQSDRQQKIIETLRHRAVAAGAQRDHARRSVNLPDDPSLGTHGYLWRGV